MWTTVVVPSSAGMSQDAPWPEDALTGGVLRSRLCPGPGDATGPRRGRLRSRRGRPYAGVITTHYDTLGVARDATPQEIRAAYVARARRHHPDVAAPDADAGSMAAVNEAYDVLRRPGARTAYDRELAGRRTAADGPAAGPGVADDAEPPGPTAATKVLTPSGPARMPWKLMGIAAAVGSVVVIASAAFTDSPSDEPPDGILRIGSCVEVEPNYDVREVDCATSPGLVVRQMLPTGATCPQPLATHRDRLGLGTACVEAVEDGA